MVHPTHRKLNNTQNSLTLDIAVYSYLWLHRCGHSSFELNINLNKL